MPIPQTLNGQFLYDVKIPKDMQIKENRFALVDRNTLIPTKFNFNCVIANIGHIWETDPNGFCDVKVSGVCYVEVSDATIRAGNCLVGDGDGRAIPVMARHAFPLAIALESASEVGQIIKVRLI